MKKEELEEVMEGWETEMVNTMHNTMHNIFQAGLAHGRSDFEENEWVKAEIKIAYDKGFKDGQESVAKAYEGANKKIYEG